MMMLHQKLDTYLDGKYGREKNINYKINVASSNANEYTKLNIFIFFLHFQFVAHSNEI